MKPQLNVVEAAETPAPSPARSALADAIERDKALAAEAQRTGDALGRLDGLVKAESEAEARMRDLDAGAAAAASAWARVGAGAPHYRRQTARPSSGLWTRPRGSLTPHGQRSPS